MDPTSTIKEWRGVDNDVLNLSPSVLESEENIETLEFDF